MDQVSHQTSPFLLLPYELRAVIYADVISGEILPPTDPLHASNRIEERQLNTSIFYPTRFHYSCTGLLLTCRRTHDEIQALLDARPPQQRLKYKLDLMITHTGVWPTWMMAPKPRDHERCDLDMELRLFNDPTAGTDVQLNTGPIYEVSYPGIYSMGRNCFLFLPPQRLFSKFYDTALL